MLCLAAALILLLMSWLIFDAILVTNHKIDTQGSADMAAFSQASVKSRSMNMMAFSNVGKRSIVGVHSVYQSMMLAYRDYMIAWIAECTADMSTCDYEALEANYELYNRERENDYSVYVGTNEAYYIADLRALDNYQKYVMAMTPWWGWSEAVGRAQRNGATLASSIPVPQGVPYGIVPNLLNDVASAVGPNTAFNFYSETDRLPLERGVFMEDRESCPGFRSMVSDGMIANDGWISGEHGSNVQIHRENSELRAASDEVIERGASFGANGTMSAGLALMAEMVGMCQDSLAAPYFLTTHSTEASWLAATSNLVLTYRHEPEYFENMRDKYRVPPEDYEFDQSSPAGRLYRPEGYWGMARSEISFQGEGAPDSWAPAWTARMRPVALPGEFREASFDLNGMYHSTLAHLALAAMLHDDVTNGTQDILKDLVFMERATRGMGQSTIDGVGR